jgi:hypothetical protein
MRKVKPRRQAMMENIDPPEKLDQTPVEIPGNASAQGKTIERQIQEQIAIQMAKKNRGA